MGDVPAPERLLRDALVRISRSRISAHRWPREFAAETLAAVDALPRDDHADRLRMLAEALEATHEAAEALAMLCYKQPGDGYPLALALQADVLRLLRIARGEGSWP